MIRTIPGFTHQPGRHCGSTSMADALRVAGISLSEATCFGLGSGLGFLYTHNSRAPTRFILGRGYLLERDLCEALGVTLHEFRDADPVQAWTRVRARVEAGVAVILSTDLKHLPYWGPQASFNGHRVVVAGYVENKAALVADTDKPGLQEVTLADLTRARASDGPPVGYTENEWWEIEAGKGARPLREAVARALHTQAERMLRDPSGFGGCDALDRFAAELPEWPATLSDFQASTLDCYRNIEKRGTGGALFRNLYAEFLEEAEKAGNVDSKRELAARARAVAEAWTRVGQALRACSANGAGKDFESACRDVAWLARAEREFASALEA